MAEDVVQLKQIIINLNETINQLNVTIAQLSESLVNKDEEINALKTQSQSKNQFGNLSETFNLRDSNNFILNRRSKSKHTSSTSKRIGDSIQSTTKRNKQIENNGIIKTKETTQLSLPTENQFDLLSKDDEMLSQTDEKEKHDNATVISESGSQSVFDWNETNEESEIDNNSKNNTPIVILFKEANEKQQLILRLNQYFTRRYLIMNSEKCRVKIKADNSTLRNNIIELLTKRGYRFHTFTPKNEQCINIVMKSLPNIDCYNENVIENELKLQGFEPIFIKPIVSFNNPNPDMVVWHIAFPPKTNIENLVKIRSIVNHRVKIERFKKKQIIQCKNCQRFHHSASNCFHEYRCVKCAQSHEIGKCALNKNDRPKCANCGGDHTANHLAACDTFKKAIDTGNSFNNTPMDRSKLQSNISNKVNKNQSYSAVTKSNIGSGANHSTGGTQLADEMSRRILTKLLHMIQSIIANGS